MEGERIFFFVLTCIIHRCSKFFLTDNYINSIHHQATLANEPEVNVIDSQDFLLATGARVCKSCNCKKLLLLLNLSVQQ